MTVVLGFLNTGGMVEKFDKFDKSDWIHQRLTNKHIPNKCLYKALWAMCQAIHDQLYIIKMLNGVKISWCIASTPYNYELWRGK